MKVQFQRIRIKVKIGYLSTKAIFSKLPDTHLLPHKEISETQTPATSQPLYKNTSEDVSEGSGPHQCAFYFSMRLGTVVSVALLYCLE